MQNKPSRDSRKTKTLDFLQWNCRGLRVRRAELNLRLQQEPKDALLLQEINGDNIGLRGYRSFTSPSIIHKRGKKETVRAQVAVYLRKPLPYEQLDTTQWCNQTQEIVAVRTTDNDIKIILISVYYRPALFTNDEHSWLTHFVNTYPKHHIVIGGDFNAWHADWGQDQPNERGVKIQDEYEKAGLNLLNDPEIKTRLGQGPKQKDTTPDLTLASQKSIITWKCDNNDPWGSDHFPIHITLELGSKLKLKRNSKTIIWDDFRTILNQEYHITNIDELTHAMKEASVKATIQKAVNADGPNPDTHLLSLWRHRQELIDKYRTSRNRKDLTEANKLAKEAQSYANKLCIDNWNDLCESFNEHTSITRMWSICNSMLGKKKEWGITSNIALRSNKTLEEVLEETGPLFFPQPATKPNAIIYTPTVVEDQHHYNCDFTVWELEAAIANGRTRSAPGPDQITNSMLKNLPECARAALLEQINIIWKLGEMPEDWKMSWVTPIPKPGKVPDKPQNTRPISLTSILCKLVERMTLARIDWFTDKNGTYHPAQTGFRKNLGTHDSLILLRETVLKFTPEAHSTRMLVAVDIKKAFDSLPHDVIIKTMETQGILGRPLNLIKTFLKNRRYVIKVGKDQSSTKSNDIGVP